MTTALLAVIVVTAVTVRPVEAASNVTASGENFFCKSGGGTTNVGTLVSQVVFLIVTIAGMIGVVGGAGFTLASAAQPTNEEYQDRRNKTILYGGGTLLVLYGANAVVSQLSDNLDFSCVLPFL